MYEIIFFSLPQHSFFCLQEVYSWKSWPAGVYDSHWAHTAAVFFLVLTQTCTQWVLTAHIQLQSLLQLHLLSPWRSCLLLNPPAQKHTHSDREIGRLRLPLCLIWCYGTHRITALSKPKPICTNTHTHSSWPG